MDKDNERPNFIVSSIDYLAKKKVVDTVSLSFSTRVRLTVPVTVGAVSTLLIPWGILPTFPHLTQLVQLSLYMPMLLLQDNTIH